MYDKSGEIEKTCGESLPSQTGKKGMKELTKKISKMNDCSFVEDWQEKKKFMLIVKKYLNTYQPKKIDKKSIYLENFSEFFNFSNDIETFEESRYLLKILAKYSNF